MTFTNRWCAIAVFAACLVPQVMTSGCAVRVSSGRYYDPYRSDYHNWDDHENVYYNQWVVETHRDHREFPKLKKNEQQQYWRWRHDHPDK